MSTPPHSKNPYTASTFGESFDMMRDAGLLSQPIIHSHDVNLGHSQPYLESDTNHTTAERNCTINDEVEQGRPLPCLEAASDPPIAIQNTTITDHIDLGPPTSYSTGTDPAGEFRNHKHNNPFDEGTDNTSVSTGKATSLSVAATTPIVESQRNHNIPQPFIVDCSPEANLATQLKTFDDNGMVIDFNIKLLKTSCMKISPTWNSNVDISLLGNID